MRHLVLHASSVANNGDFLDAGTEVEIGDEDGQVSADRAREIVRQGRGKSHTVDDALDHDGDGKAGGSLKGEDSTVAKGAAKRGQGDKD